MSSVSQPEAGEFIYRYRPRMIGGGCEFRLGKHDLEYNIGGVHGRVSYPMISHVRISFRPSNFGARRYIAEIWQRTGPRLEIHSGSHVSLVGIQDHSADFNMFMRELHRRIVAAGGDCSFEAGFAPWRWWPLLALSSVMGLALVYILINTLSEGEMGGAALILLFLGLFAWQVVPLVQRNVPRSYSPEPIPDDVLPAV